MNSHSPWLVKLATKNRSWFNHDVVTFQQCVEWRSPSIVKPKRCRGGVFPRWLTLLLRPSYQIRLSIHVINLTQTEATPQTKMKRNPSTDPNYLSFLFVRPNHWDAANRDMFPRKSQLVGMCIFPGGAILISSCYFRSKDCGDKANP